MESQTAGVGFKIWGVDNLVYGPAELPMLVRWVKEERVTKDTWVYSEKDDVWQKAAQVPELRMFFQPKTAPAAAVAGANVSEDTAIYAVRPGTLRRVKIFADFGDPQLQRFVQFM